MMKKQLIALIAALLLWPAVANAAQETVHPLFKANNIAVLFEDRFLPYDPDLFAQTGQIDLQGSEPQPDFLWQPDGQLLVAQGNFVRAFDEAGSELFSFDFTQPVNGLELAPGGEIIVMTNDDIIVFDFLQGEKTGVFDLADGTAPCLFPGDILAFAVNTTTPPTVLFLDLKSGMVTGKALSPNDEPIGGIARRADGVVALTAGNELFLFDSTVQKVLAGPEIVGSEPQPNFQPQPDFLPNGDVLVVADNTLLQLDGKSLAPVQQAGLGVGADAIAAAVVPHRFEAELDGFLARGDSTVIKIKAPALVSWTPGSGRTVLQMGSPEAAKLLGDTFVLHGLEADDFGDKGQRLVEGSQTQGTQAAFGSDAFGFTGLNSFYFADGFDAQIQAGREGSVLLGTVNSKSLLNGIILPLD